MINVLVVEDQAAFRNAIVAYLEQARDERGARLYNVIAHPHGKPLDSVPAGKLAAAACPPDLAILDIDLHQPHEGDGMDLGIHLRTAYRTPVVYLTNNVDDRVIIDTLHTYSTALNKTGEGINAKLMATAINTVRIMKAHYIPAAQGITLRAKRVRLHPDGLGPTLNLAATEPDQDLNLIWDTLAAIATTNSVTVTLDDKKIKIGNNHLMLYLGNGAEGIYIRSTFEDIWKLIPKDRFIQLNQGTAVNAAHAELKRRLTKTYCRAAGQDFTVTDAYKQAFKQRMAAKK